MILTKYLNYLANEIKAIQHEKDITELKFPFLDNRGDNISIYIRPQDDKYFISNDKGTILVADDDSICKRIDILIKDML